MTISKDFFLIWIRQMMGNQKDFLIFVCAVLMLSSTVASLSILPRVTRTSDSIIIDCKI